MALETVATQYDAERKVRLQAELVRNGADTPTSAETADGGDPVRDAVMAAAGGPRRVRARTNQQLSKEGACEETDEEADGNQLEG